MRRFVLVLLLLVLVGGGLYLAGYWPERQRRLQAEQGGAAAQAQLADLQARVRLAELTDQVFMAVHHLSERNFGLAREQASRFFEGARAEMARTSRPEVRAALEAALGHRDAVITALTQGDASITGVLYGILERLRQAAGRPALPALAGGLASPPGVLPTPSVAPPPASLAPPATPTPFAPSPMATFPPPTPRGQQTLTRSGTS